MRGQPHTHTHKQRVKQSNRRRVNKFEEEEEEEEKGPAAVERGDDYGTRYSTAMQLPTSSTSYEGKKDSPPSILPSIHPSVRLMVII